jgi:hypothetical protein
MADRRLLGVLRIASVQMGAVAVLDGAVIKTAGPYGGHALRFRQIFGGAIAALCQTEAQEPSQRESKRKVRRSAHCSSSVCARSVLVRAMTTRKRLKENCSTRSGNPIRGN